ncbi:hypothetical protein FHS72_002835 [Loktanella ponticola]|uniref:Uncharacterized protein n=1 Tax=Yoonia ponticola TaxID=1524255 RepID=A0A7W9BME0_9RHOB|nr:hypothetical protein [Yoonia ponticola]
MNLGGVNIKPLQVISAILATYVSLDTKSPL